MILFSILVFGVSTSLQEQPIAKSSVKTLNQSQNHEPARHQNLCARRKVGKP